MKKVLKGCSALMLALVLVLASGCNPNYRPEFEYGDFICREIKMLIELDGGQHNEQSNIVYDLSRTKYLENKGYKVIRFWNNDIDNNLDGVYLQLKNEFGVND